MTRKHSPSLAGLRGLLCFSICFLLLAGNGLRSQTSPAGPARNEKDGSSSTHSRVEGVPFTSGTHGPLLADLYLPAGKGLHAAVVFLHGGAWKSGDRTQLQDVAAYLADRGYVGMAVDYDMTDKGDRFPTPLEQSERAVAWLRQNAKKYRVDAGRIAVAGSSAGGELAALVALDRTPVPGAQVKAAVIFNGVLDLTDARLDPQNMVAPYLGGTCAMKAELCRQASPVFQVRRGAPPFFVGHGTADAVVPYSQAEHFVQLLRSNEVQVTPFVAPDAGHTYWKSDAWFAQNMKAVQSFLEIALPAGKPKA